MILSTNSFGSRYVLNTINSRKGICIVWPVRSRKKSKPDSSGTIQAQIEFLRNYVALYGLEVAGEYLDDGISGTVPLAQRPVTACDLTLHGECLLSETPR